MSSAFTKKEKQIIYDLSKYVDLIDCSNRKVSIDLLDVAKFSPELCEGLIEDYTTWKGYLLDKIQEKFKLNTGSEKKVYIHIKPTKVLPKVEIGNLNNSNVGKLCRFSGTVIRLEPTMVLTKNIYECSICNQKYVFYKQRRQCSYCGRNTLTLIDQEYTCYREFYIQEYKQDVISEETIRCEMPIADDPKCNYTDIYQLLGRKVEITGYITKRLIRITSSDRAIYRFYIKVLGMKAKQTMKLTDKQKEEYSTFIKENKDNLMDILINEIWYDVFGYEKEKKLILLHLLGLQKEDYDLDRKSKQMICVIVGDKGRVKTTLAKSFMRLMPDSRMVTATSTAQGLLIGLEKTEGGGYTAVLGEIPACNNSVCVLEECDKMNEDAQNQLLPVLSDGIIKITKIKKFSMSCHINFMIIANPQGQKFDMNRTFFSQINMGLAFLDRADAIIIMPIAFNQDNKFQYVKKVLRPKKHSTRYYSDEFIGGILHYLKHYPQNPLLTDLGEKAIYDKWNWLQEQQDKISDDRKDDTKDFESRAIVSILKISKAYGRLHGYQYVTQEVVEKAFNIYYDGCLKLITKDFGLEGLDGFGKQLGDMKKQIPKVSNDDDRRNFMLNFVTKYQPIDQDQLVAECKDKMGITTTKCEQLFRQLHDKDEITIQQGKVTAKWKAGIDSEYVEDVKNEPEKLQEWIMERLKRSRCTELEIVEEAVEIGYKDDDVYAQIDYLKSKTADINFADGKLGLNL